MTQAEAIALYDAKFWEGMTHRKRAMFQMWEARLCMPFDVFQEAVEKTLGRGVWTHEFGLNRDGLKRELLGGGDPPTMDYIIAMIPANKRVLLVKP